MDPKAASCAEALASLPPAQQSASLDYLISLLGRETVLHRCAAARRARPREDSLRAYAQACMGVGAVWGEAVFSEDVRRSGMSLQGVTVPLQAAQGPAGT